MNMLFEKLGILAAAQSSKEYCNNPKDSYTRKYRLSALVIVLSPYDEGSVLFRNSSTCRPNRLAETLAPVDRTAWPKL
jgi:hypothetical protein